MTVTFNFTITDIPVAGAHTESLEIFDGDTGAAYDFSDRTFRLQVGPRRDTDDPTLILDEADGDGVSQSVMTDPRDGMTYNLIELRFPAIKTGITAGTYQADLWADLIGGTPDYSYLLGRGTIEFIDEASR